MRARLFDHIDLRVTNLTEADAFYGVVLPALGFTQRIEEVGAVAFDTERDHPKPEFVVLIPDPAHVPNRTRIAFWCDTKEEVDEFAHALGKAAARNVEGPAYCEEYNPSYYAIFFEDPCGNRFEVCCRTAPPRRSEERTK